MKIRPYNSNDKATVIELLELNTPEYFDVAEKEDFIRYLETEIEDYFIVESEDNLIGAGGINYLFEEGKARISWDFVHPKMQGRGVGRLLMKHRIHHLSSKGEIKWIEVRTSQLAYPFYEKMGFHLVEVDKDYWARGFDLYKMDRPNTE